MLETLYFMAKAGVTRCNVVDYTPDMGPLCDVDGNLPDMPLFSPAAADGTTPAPAAADGTTPAPAAADGTTPAPAFLLVKKTGKKFYVIQASGEPVEGVAGIDADGYKTDVDAWAAIKTLSPSV